MLTQADTMERQAGRTPDFGPARPSWRRRGGYLILLCVFTVLVFYLRAAWSYHKSLSPLPDSGPTLYDFENRVADALLSRQLSLKTRPPKGLLQLENPYDPRANVGYRFGSQLHDLSLYKGKLYSYFGPAPAILLYIPFRALRVGDISPTLATLTFCTLGFLFSLALFRLLVRWCLETIPVWMQCVAVFALGLGVPTAWMIYIGRDYEATIACAYMLLFGGAYLLARGILLRPSGTFLALGSATLAFAVAARPTMVVAGFFLVVAAILVLGGEFDSSRRNTLLAAIIAPYVAIGALIAVYNFARFGSIFEFGQSYQLAGFNPQIYEYGRISYLPKGIFYYLFSRARVMNEYPYLFLRATALDPSGLLPTRGYHNEPVAGLFTNMPAAAAGYLLLATDLRRAGRFFPKILATLGVLLVPALGALLLMSYQYRGTTMRYELDFAPLIVMGSLLAWVGWNKSSPRPRWVGWLGNGFFLAALGATMAFSLAITLTPCQGTGSC
jgi:hypothetical protein